MRGVLHKVVCAVPEMQLHEILPFRDLFLSAGVIAQLWKTFSRSLRQKEFCDAWIRIFKIHRGVLDSFSSIKKSKTSNNDFFQQ